jgi:multiple sugar transport system ATP-binding protein
MASVILQNVAKRFGKTEVIQPLSVTMESDQLTVLVGPSGCGKSTLLRMIAGLETPSQGDVIIGGERVNDVPPFQRGVSMVFQSYALYPHMTVYENLRFGLTSLKIPKAQAEARIQKAADVLGLVPYLTRKPKQLSGGQRQRVAMGRALVRNPKVFLFDEPLSNLDAALRTKMRIEIARLRQSMGATAVYVTHDQVEAMTLADKIVVLRAGRIEQQGAPLDVYNRPANKFVAGFMGSPSMNFIPVVHTQAASNQHRLDLPGGARIGFESEVQDSLGDDTPQWEVGLRPEHLSTDPSMPIKIRGQVYAVERLGDQSLVHVNIAGTDKAPASQIIARLTGDLKMQNFDEIELGFDSRRCHLFSGTGQAVQTPLEVL